MTQGFVVTQVMPQEELSMLQCQNCCNDTSNETRVEQVQATQEFVMTQVMPQEELSMLPFAMS